LIKRKGCAEFEYITMFYDQIFLFYSIDDKKAKVNTLYVRSVDKLPLAINNDKQKVCEITFEKKGMMVLLISFSKITQK